ncbi:hypothetical protein B0H14DRAFT_2738581, partial [Mycena olivaceomarginata]
LHAMLAFLAAHVVSSSSRTPWLFSSVPPSLPDAWACRTPWHHLHCPPACAVRAMVVPHRRHRIYRILARQVRLQQI